MKRSANELAEDAIRRTGSRVTSPRVTVLAALLSESRALTHQEIEQRLQRSRGIDRVTLYRVLDWLVQYGLAHRIATGDRTWRFDATDREHGHRHAHFQCGDCGTVVCLDDAGAPPTVNLPAGFRSHEIELTVKGTCAHCGRRRSKPRKPPERGHAQS
jgi:Fur family ferric uptake transcriptional regulator